VIRPTRPIRSKRTTWFSGVVTASPFGFVGSCFLDRGWRINWCFFDYSERINRSFLDCGWRINWCFFDYSERINRSFLDCGGRINWCFLGRGGRVVRRRLDGLGSSLAA